MKKTMNKAKKKTQRAKLTPQQIDQRNQKKEIRQVFSNLGFERLIGVDGKHFEYENRRSELDDIFIFENVVVIVEYTVGNPHEHILKKSFIYERINKDHAQFLKFLYDGNVFDSFCQRWDEIKSKYSFKQIQLRILYCSKSEVSDEDRKLINGVSFFDYHVIQYFKSLSKVIKFSAKYEFFEFLNIDENYIGERLRKSVGGKSESYYGHILPEEYSSFKPGHKIISFYIDAGSLMKRAYVLRREGWNNKDSIGYYQRMLDIKKIASMRKYLSTKERVYINNIIATISEDHIRLYSDERKTNELHLNNLGEFENNNEPSQIKPVYVEIEDMSKIIGIIDGQHRTFSYYEGNDVYEKEISRLRDMQNLLVTGILFPRNESVDERLKFEANLFLEINMTQSKVPSNLQQEIESILDPFSTISIGKRIINELNANGPLKKKMEQYTYDKGKIKTASIVSFGLKPLIKYEGANCSDSIFQIWDNINKNNLKNQELPDYELLKEYVLFSSSKIKELLIALKINIGSDLWKPYDPKDKTGVLTVTFINGTLNLLRLLIEHGKVSSQEEYEMKLKGVENFNFRDYKSSQYRKMGEALYMRFFHEEDDEP